MPQLRKYSMVIFSISFLFMMVHTHSLFLDLESPDLFMFLSDGKKLSFPELASKLAIPGSAAYFDVSSVEKRPVEGLVLKGIYSLFGLSPRPFYVFKSVLYAVVVTFVFVFIFKSTNTIFWSFFGAVFFMSIPGPVLSIFYVYDFGIVAEAFLLAAFFLFIKNYCITSNISERTKIVIFLLIVLGLKSKDSALFAPFVLVLFVLVTKMKMVEKYAFLFILLLIFSQPFLPFLLGVRQGRPSLQTEISMDYVIERVLHNPEKVFNYGQTRPILFSIKESLVFMPSSLIASLGFFFGWSFVGMVLYLLIRHRSRVVHCITHPNKAFNEASICEKYFFFLIVWFVVLVSFYSTAYVPSGALGTDIRYLTSGFVIFTVLVFSSASLFFNDINKRFGERSAKNVCTLLCCCIVFALLVNMFHTSIHLRGVMAIRNTVTEQTMKIIYEDAFQEIPRDDVFFTVQNYCYGFNETRCKRDSALRSFIFTEYPSSIIGGLSLTKDALKQTVNEFNHAYVVSFSGVIPINITSRDSLKTKQFSRVNICHTDIFTRVYCWFRANKYAAKRDTLYFYKVERASVA